MMHKVMFVYEFEGRTASQVGKINRELFGYTDKSNHGNYKYIRGGLLSKLSIKRLARGVLLTDYVNDTEVLTSLKSMGAKKIVRYYLNIKKVVHKF